MKCNKLAGGVTFVLVAFLTAPVPIARGQLKGFDRPDRDDKETKPKRDTKSLITLSDPFAALSPDTRLLAARGFASDGRFALVESALAGIPAELRDWEFDLLSTRARGLGFFEKARNTGIRGQIFAMDFSPDGSTIAVGGGHVQMYLLDAQTGKVRRILDAQKSWTYAIRFSPDGALMASAHGNGRTLLWNAKLGKQLSELPRQSKQVRDLSFSPEGRTLATACLDGQVRVWNLRDGAELFQCGPHRYGAAAVSFSPDGSRLASMSLHGEVFLWNATSGEQIDLFVERGTFKSASLAFSPDGRTLACGFPGKTILLDTSSARVVRRLGGASRGMPKVAFAPDGRSVFTARDQTVCRWDVDTGRPLSCLSGALGTFQSIRLNSDASTMALGGDGRVFIYSTGVGDVHRLAGDSDFNAASLGFSANGQHLLVGRQHGYDTWNVSGEARESHDLPAERVLAFSENGEFLATADQTHKILVRNRSTGELQQKLDGHRRSVGLAEFSRSNRYLVTGGVDKNVRIWNLSDHRQYWSIDDLQSPVAALAISPGESHVAVAEHGTSTGIYRIRSRTVVGYFDQPATAVDYTTHDILATGGRDLVIRMWEGHSGKMLGVMYGHEDVITALRFTQDGKRLASAAADGTVRLWDPRSGIELLRFDLEGRVPKMLAFGPDDRQLAVVDSQGSLHIWDRQRVWSPARNEWLSVADLAAEAPSE